MHTRDRQNLNTILAALRYWQHARGDGSRRATEISETIECDGDVCPLNDEEIDDLCERLNCGELVLSEDPRMRRTKVRT